MASLIVSAWSGFDVRDVFVFGGMAMLGYGLRDMYGLGLAMVVCGGVLLVFGSTLLFVGKR